MAKEFADAGANVLIVARNADAAAAAELGERVSRFAADVSDPEGCAAFAHAAEQRYGGIDVLCANAGIFPEKRLDDLSASYIETALSTNLKGTIFSVQACVPALTPSGHGRVIISSSITGPITGYPGLSVYGASKAGQLGFTRTAAIELAGRHITVNAVLPGNVMTEGILELGEKYLESMKAAIPVGALATSGTSPTPACTSPPTRRPT